MHVCMGSGYGCGCITVRMGSAKVLYKLWGREYVGEVGLFWGRRYNNVHIIMKAYISDNTSAMLSIFGRAGGTLLMAYELHALYI